VVGTTVAPWQLFFQQSNVIDKRITPRWLDYEKADTVLGAFVVVVGAACIMMASASAFMGTPDFGHFTDALESPADWQAISIRSSARSSRSCFRRLDCRRVSRHPRDLVCIR